MIHSLCGGVIRENGMFDFAKVTFAGEERPYWYLCPFPDAEAGRKVIAPFGRGDALRTGVIVRIERNVSEQAAPYPMNRIRAIERLL